VTSLFQEVFGTRAHRVALATRDRFLSIELDGSWTIVFTPFGPRPNVLLVRETTPQAVVRSLSREDEWVDKAPPVPRPAREITSYEHFVEEWSSQSIPPLRRLSRLFPLLDKVHIREALFRGGIARLDEEEEPPPDRIYGLVRTIEEELETPTAHVYTLPEGTLLSQIELRHLADLDVEEFDSMNTAVAHAVRSGLRRQAVESVREPMEARVRREIDRSQSALRQISKAERAATRAKEYEKWGHLLMAHASTLSGGEHNVEVPDVMESGDPITIPVKPELSPVENATRYYEKAGKLRRERDLIPQRKEEIEARLRLLEEALTAIHEASNAETLRALQKDRLDPLGLDESRADDGRPRPFRRFVVFGGFEVLVGRNARENELLTWKTASKHDLWFHARGVSGSHVVLRVSSKSAEVPRRAREQAAAIAAYYSKARGSGMAAVHMTERKYLARAKGADTGTVRLLREDVLLVEPALPDPKTGKRTTNPTKPTDT
jgi:predicted ribosome quality control (RQC) complex YloA/Tae2 family protein